MIVRQIEGPSSVTRKRVVVVGGGLAGLSAAECLARHYPQQFDISVLESKRITGGRAGSFNDPDSGDQVDYCQHVAMGCCTNFLGLMNRCGLSDQLHRYTRLRFLHPDVPESIFAPSRWLPPPFHLVSTLNALRYLDREQRRQIRRALFQLFRTPSESLTGILAGDWLREHGQSAKTIDAFWSVIVVSALGETTDFVSMAAVRKVFVDGFAASRGASDILVPKLPLADLIGTRLANRIRNLGVQVCEGHPVRAIEEAGEGALISLDNGVTRQADHVVVAVPWYAIASILPMGSVAHLEQFNEVPASPITGLHLWFDRQITQKPHAVMVGTTSQWLFRQPWAMPSEAGATYYQVVISASRDARSLSKETLVKTVVQELRAAFSDARDAKLLKSRIVTDPKSVFSIRPEFEAIRPATETIHGWLHLAGDWIATGWPATMEGAVISGRMAVASIARCESLPTPAIGDGLPRGWLARKLIKP